MENYLRKKPNLLWSDFEVGVAVIEVVVESVRMDVLNVLETTLS
jgi:hypothetical protein